MIEFQNLVLTVETVVEFVCSECGEALEAVEDIWDEYYKDVTVKIKPCEKCRRAKEEASGDH